MVIFFNGRNDTKVAIPENRIFRISLENSEVVIFYDGGEITWLDETSESVAPKIETAVVRYESEELALENFRDYFTACEKHKGAFFFG